MTASPGAAPGIEAHPGHEITIQRAATGWRAQIGGTVLADSSDALLLDETNYSRAVYFPESDVVLEHLVTVDDITYCPFKGTARYFRLAAGDSRLLVGWYYPVTYEEVLAIRGFVAFYPDRVALSEHRFEFAGERNDPIYTDEAR